MKTTFLSLVYVFLSNTIFSQSLQWAKQFTGPLYGTNINAGTAIRLDKYGNVYVTGNFQSTVDFDPGPAVFNMTTTGNFASFVAKYDTSGGLKWAKCFLNTDYIHTPSMSIDSSGNVYTCGYFRGDTDFDPGANTFNLTHSSLAGYDAYISKLDSNGNFVWAVNFGAGSATVNATSIDTDPSGNIYTTGTYNQTIDFDPGAGIANLTAPGNGDVFIMKMNSAGNLLWVKSTTGNVNTGFANIGAAVEVDFSGNVLITGKYYGVCDFDPGIGVSSLSSGSPAGFVLKLDNSGNFVWAKGLGLAGYSCFGTALTTDSSGNVYSTGSFSGFVDFDPGPALYLLNGFGANSYIWKLDSNGNFVFAKNVNTLYNSEKFTAICLNNDGDLYLTGGFEDKVDFDPGIGVFSLTSISSGYTNIFILKLDNNGEFRNAKVFKSPGRGLGYSLTIDQTGNIYTSGEVGIPYTNFDPDGGVYNLYTGIQAIYMSKLKLCETHDTLNIHACNFYNLLGQMIITTDSIILKSYLSSYGCDSIVVYSIHIHHVSNTNISYNACDSISLGGQWYTASVTDTLNYINQGGCDSNIIANITINHSSSNQINVSGCSPFVLNGQTYTSTGTYTQTLVNSTGCDSVLTVNLNISGNASFDTLSFTNCDSVSINNVTYDSSGSYTQLYSNAAGCDSVLTLNVTIHSVQATASQSGSMLSANTAGASYQWLWCNPYQIIAGATNPSYNALSNGDYAVVVTQNGCSDTSVCLNVTGIGINNYPKSPTIQIYPNPVTEKLYIESEDIFQNAKIRLLDITGRVVMEFTPGAKNKTEIDISTLVSGIYFVNISNQESNFSRKIIKR